MKKTNEASQTDGVWASDIAKEFATRQGGDFLDQIARAKTIFDEIEFSIRSEDLNIYARGVSGMVNRKLRDHEPAHPVGDYYLSRRTIEEWWKKKDSNPARAMEVEANVAKEKPDPERRLDELRTLGGNAKFISSTREWKFTGISSLVAAEKKSGRKRSSEKTIRKDLKEAAAAEREKRAAGHFDGLGGR